MAGPRSQVNKPHKTRFASKATRQIHKTNTKGDQSRIGKSHSNVAKGARASRLQRNKMVREQKRAAVLKEKRSSSGYTSSPRVIVLLPLSSSVNIDSLENDIEFLLSDEDTRSGLPTIASSTYKLRVTILKAPHGDILSCMEMAKVADMIAFVTSAKSSCEESDSGYIDSFGSQCLSVFRSLGLPSTTVLIRDLPAELKKRNEAKKMCNSKIAAEFPEDCKFFSADTRDELHKFMSLFKEQRLTVPHWRTQRPYLMAEKVDMVVEDQNSGNCTLLLTGYLRAHSISVNQLVHVAGAGDYQLSKIEVLEDPHPLNDRKMPDFMDSDEEPDLEVIQVLLPDPLRQEPLLVENVPDPLVGDQIHPTEAEMLEAEQSRRQKKHKERTLPRGTSDYQAAWIVDSISDEDSSSDDDADDGMVLDVTESNLHGHDRLTDFDDDLDSLHPRDSDEETERDNMTTDDENLTKEDIEAEIQKIKTSHADDIEFPDEVDTPVDVPARKRFAKYRGLKSFRTSSWDSNECLPPEYARIFAFSNFARTQKLALAKSLDIDQGNRDDCVPDNSFIRLYIKDVPINISTKLCELANKLPITVCGLLQHESKMSVLHFSIKKLETYTEPIKAKEELVFHVGFRQFVARPTFSSDGVNADKQKMERFLHAGRFSIASIYAPISFHSLPLIALKGSDTGGKPVVAAVGSLRSVDPDKIILKKIILTGYPQRVSKSKASVRYMFHNPEDVRWFKPVEVWSKCGRRGRIKEPVGTHGAMKVILNGVLQQHDTVCMSLFKRTYPKWTDRRFPLLEN